MFESVFLLNTVKIIHIIAVISWMAGLLYLPRIFVYHCGTKNESEMSEIFKIMEYKLFNYIMNPAMIVTWICGLYLAYIFDYYKNGWFHFKFLSVILLTIFHFKLQNHIISFKNNKNTHNHKYFRVMNEVPTILMIIIVILVIVKPL